jgi:hypothetical protein
MQEPEKLNLAEDEFTVALRKLRPAAGNRSAREVWYEAGYQSGRRSVNLWRATAAALLVGMSGVVTWEHRSGLTRSDPSAAWAVDHAPTRSAPTTNPVAGSDSGMRGQAITNAGSAYLQLRDSLIRDGLDGLERRDLPSGNRSEPRARHDSRELDIENMYLTNVRG